MVNMTPSVVYHQDASALTAYASSRLMQQMDPQVIQSQSAHSANRVLARPRPVRPQVANVPRDELDCAVVE